MDLWIRRQNKRGLTNVRHIDLDIPLASGECGIKGYYSDKSYIMLGYYVTEKGLLNC